MLVVDASVLAPIIADAGPDGEALRARLRGEAVAGPDLVRLEVVSVLRRQAAAGQLTPAQAGAAIEDLLDLPLSVFPTAPLLRRAWELRDKVTAYDACYVALAEALGCTLLSADARLAGAPGAQCAIDLL